MNETRYERARAAIDAAHSEDPNKVTTAGVDVPYELHYADKMTAYLEKRYPAASEELKLAIRAQHFRRWEVPRSSYPTTKAGYHAWRTFLKKRQAELAGEICANCDYDEDEVRRIESMIRKEDMRTDEETQVLEDVACLVFLDDQFEEFEKEHNEEKIVGILRKTWAKMSPRGHEIAMEINMSERASSLIARALRPA